MNGSGKNLPLASIWALSTARPPYSACTTRFGSTLLELQRWTVANWWLPSPKKGGHDHRRPQRRQADPASSRGLPSRRNSIQSQSLIKPGKTTFRKTTLRAEFRLAPQDKRLNSLSGIRWAQFGLIFLFSRRWWKPTIGIEASLFRGHAELSELLEHTEAPSKSNSNPGPAEKIHDAAACFCRSQISHFGVLASMASTIPSGSWPYRKSSSHRPICLPCLARASPSVR